MQKFKIESSVQALASIDPNDYMFSFNLKLAYLQVPVNENFWPFLGFAIQTPTATGMTERNFWYKMLPFGLNDAVRVLTKLMRSPIKHWSTQGISVFLHIDDGFSFANSREAVVAKFCCSESRFNGPGFANFRGKMLMGRDTKFWNGQVSFGTLRAFSCLSLTGK